MNEASPYRGEDASWFQTFGQHVGIAEGCLEDLSPLAQRFAASVRFALDSTLLTLCNQVGSAWESMWIQLDQARSVAAKRGRDVSAYDAARKQVRDTSSAAISFEVSLYHPTRFPPGQQLAYRTKESIFYYVPEESLARAAVAALRSAVPEVVVPEAPRSEASAEPWQRTALGHWAAVIIAVVVAGFAMVLLLSR